MVEFAILAPLLFLLLFGIIEMSRGIFAYTTVWSGAREGARFATTTDDAGGTPNFSDCDEITAAVENLVVSADIDDISITYGRGPAVIADCDATTPIGDPTTAGISNGDVVTVAVAAEFDSVVPLLESFLDGLDLSSSQSRTIFVETEVDG